MHPPLLKAYRNTSYQVGDATAQIGRRSWTMDHLLVRHHAREAILITAYNPFSRKMPTGWNQRMQRQLGQALRRHRVLMGKGSWQRWSECHFLVLCAAAPMRKLARDFRQHGIVIVRLRQPTELEIGF
jgi:hypothetical protein